MDLWVSIRRLQPTILCDYTFICRSPSDTRCPLRIKWMVALTDAGERNGSAVESHSTRDPHPVESPSEATMLHSNKLGKTLLGRRSLNFWHFYTFLMMDVPSAPTETSFIFTVSTSDAMLMTQSLHVYQS